MLGSEVPDLQWRQNARVEWADHVDQDDIAVVNVAFDGAWLHIEGQLAVRSVPARDVKRVLWSPNGTMVNA